MGVVRLASVAGGFRNRAHVQSGGLLGLSGYGDGLGGMLRGKQGRFG